MTGDGDAPGELVIRVPCGPAYQANLLGAINWLTPRRTNPGPAQQVLERLLVAVRDAEYQQVSS